MSKPIQAPSLFARTLLALLLLIAFYLFAVGLALLLFAIPAFLHEKSDRVNVQLLIGCWLSAFWIIFSIIPRRESFVAPGPLLREEQYPDLFHAIREVAQLTRQEMLKEVYLLLEMNAFVSQRGGFMGLFGRRIMGVGLPLLEIMSVPEFKAVLAHEFGHYRRGDTALGPWIYATRASITRTIENASNDVVRCLFVGFVKLFLRITHAVSRREEFAADAVASEAFGTTVFAGSLRKLEEHDLSFLYYLQSEWSPLINAKVVVPLLKGYRSLLASPEATVFLKRVQAERSAAGTKPDPYDTHPTTEQRLAAIAGLDDAGKAAVTYGNDDLRATALLPDLDAAEKQLFDDVLVRPADGSERKSIDWDDVLDVVYIPLWREKLKRYDACLESVPVDELASLSRDRPRLRALFGERLSELAEDEWEAEVRNVFGAALALFLEAHGFKGTAKVAEEITYVCGNMRIYPFYVMAADHPKCPDPEAWQALCREAAISRLLLGTRLEIVY